MIARQFPSLSQAQEFPSFSQASNVFVTFDFGFSMPPFILEVTPNGKVTLTPPATPLRTGYTFGGWFADAERTTQWDFNSTVGGESFTLYAKWTAIVYVITYYLNGGVNHPDNPATYTVEDADITLKKPSRDSDIFISWFKDAAFYLPAEVIRTQEARDISVYASFLAKRETVVAAKESDIDRFGGDPKLFFTDDGFDLRYIAGQPVMEKGLENQAYISLFTREGWAGNVFLPPENRVGSDYEDTCAGSITLSKLADIENSAVRAMTSKAFQRVSAEAKNPRSDILLVEIKAGSGGPLTFSREGGLWRNQREKPIDHSGRA